MPTFSCAAPLGVTQCPAPAPLAGCSGPLPPFLRLQGSSQCLWHVLPAPLSLFISLSAWLEITGYCLHPSSALATVPLLSPNRLLLLKAPLSWGPAPAPPALAHGCWLQLPWVPLGARGELCSQDSGRKGEALGAAASPPLPQLRTLARTQRAPASALPAADPSALPGPAGGEARGRARELAQVSAM